MSAHLEVVSAYRQVPRGAAAANYASIAIVPDPRERVRPQVQIALVLDTSSSMRGHLGDYLGPRKIDLVKAAAKDVAGGLRDGDAFCLVTFSERAAVAVPAQVLSGDRSALLAAIDTLTTQGGTRMARGIAAAQEQIRSLPPTVAARRLVVLTDGRTPDEARCRELAEASEIPFILAGIGDDYNRHLLDEMARAAQGSNTAIEHPEAIAALFARVIAGAEDTVLVGARLELDFGAHFYPRRLHQVFPLLRSYPLHPITASDRQTAVPLGDIGSGGMLLLLEYAYVGSAVAGRRRVAGATLRHDGARDGDPAAQAAISLVLADDPAFPAMDAAVRQAVDSAAVEAAQARMVHAAQAGDVDQTARWLGLLDERLRAAGAAAIQETVGELRERLAGGEAPQAVAESAAARRLAADIWRLAWLHVAR